MKSKTLSNFILHNTLLFGVFGVYIFILLAFLFFKVSSVQAINLIPFHTITDYIFNAGVLPLSNILGNIALFIPLGIYLTLFKCNKNICINTIWIIFISVSVEILQYLMKVGVTDIDDVILNGLGGLLGIIIFKVMNRIFKDNVRYAIEIISLIVGLAFIILMICFSSGVFGYRIRIL